MITFMPAREAVGLAVKSAMVERRHRITQIEMAEAAHMSRGTLAKKLAGKSPFTYEELVDVATKLGVSTHDLLARAERIRSAAA